MAAYYQQLIEHCVRPLQQEMKRIEEFVIMIFKPGLEKLFFQFL